MSRRARLVLFAIAGPGLAAVMLIGMHGMPAFGDYHGVYGLLLAKIAVPARTQPTSSPRSTSTSARSTHSARSSSCSAPRPAWRCC